MRIALFPVPVALASLALVGCATPPAPEPDAPERVPLLHEAPAAATLDEAHALLKARRPREALVAYMAVREGDGPRDLRRRATLGAAQALRAEGNLPGAIGVLTPLPAVVGDAADARHCALAGELLLRQRDVDAATRALLRAVAFEGDPSGAWRPAAAFNLGKCALAQGRPDRAREAFLRARKAFLALGDDRGAAACDAPLADLDAVRGRKGE